MAHVSWNRVASDARETGLSVCAAGESREDSQAVNAATGWVLGLAGPPLRLDSQAKYALVAGGAVDAYLRPSLPAAEVRIWDPAAGSLLVTEAGGRVTDRAGRALQFGGGSNLSVTGGIIATNGWIHSVFLGAGRASPSPTP
jgi:3'(2'), 5'-bisphosphate nucleotidase